MKKMIGCFLCVTLLLLSACSGVDLKEDPTVETEVQFEVSYIRTNGYHEDLGYPAIRVIRSADDLTAYYEQYKDLYDFDNGWDSAPLIEAIEKYDAAYFEDQILLMVLLEEPSGSNRHKMNALYKTDQNEIRLAIETIVPESGTADMAQWHILIEPEEGFSVSENPLFCLMLDNKKYPLYERMEVSKGAANMSLNKLAGWTYETVEQEESFGIRFFPKEAEEGSIVFWYQANGFGVCGTGLRTEKRIIGKWEASQGTYDVNEYWDYIYFTDAPGDYVFQTEGSISWWEDYAVDIDTILSTALIAQNCVSRTRIEEITKLYGDELGISYEDYTFDFDHLTGLWTIHYRKNGEPIHTYQIRAHGAIVE